jgi:hypothetical protein
MGDCVWFRLPQSEGQISSSVDLNRTRSPPHKDPPDKLRRYAKEVRSVLAANWALVYKSYVCFVELNLFFAACRPACSFRKCGLNDHSALIGFSRELENCVPGYD